MAGRAIDERLLHHEAMWPLVEARAEATPDAVMLADERGRHMTFAEYRVAAERAAAGLWDLGARPGDVVSWQLPTWIESVVLIGALSRLDAVQNPIIPIYREREVGFITRQCGARWLVVPSVWRGFGFEEMARGLHGPTVVVADRALPDGDPAVLPPAQPDPLALRWILYSSGTTADPKGAKHTDRSMGSPGRSMVYRFAIGSDDRVSVVFPLTHIGGAQWVFVSLFAGAGLILDETFRPATTIPVLAREGVTVAGSGTPFFLAYLAAQREQPDVPLFPSARCYPGGGSPKPPRLHHDVLSELGAPVMSGWGLTEFPNVTNTTLDDTDEHLALTEGFATIDNEVKAVRPDGTTCAVDEEGDLLARGVHRCMGFVDPALDAELIDAYGWLRTGDIGRIDAEGYVTITGRRKDVIIRKGENVSAKEVEDLLYDDERVREVAVVGLPDDERGELVCAVVVPSEPAAPPSLGELTDELERRGLARQKLPERLELVDVLPRNAPGKVLKHELRQRFSSPVS